MHVLFSISADDESSSRISSGSSGGNSQRWACGSVHVWMLLAMLLMLIMNDDVDATNGDAFTAAGLAECRQRR